MIQESLNVLFTMVYIMYPSWISGIYLILGSYLWLNCTFLWFRSAPVYKFAAFFSSAILILRGVVILSDYFGFLLEFYSVYSSVLESFGFAIDSDSISIAPTLIPDVIVLGASLLSLFLVWKDYMTWTPAGMLKYVGFASLMIAACLAISMFTVLYNFLIIYWAVVEGLLLRSPNHKYLSKGLAACSYLQLLLTIVPLEIQESLGYTGKHQISFVVNIAIVVIFSALARNNLQRFKLKYGDLLAHQEQSSWLKKIMILLLYFVSKVCLFLWLDNMKGFTGLIQQLWIGLTILERKIYISMLVSKFLLMPVLVISYILTYLACFWTEDQMNFQPLMLFTIVIFAYCFRLSPLVKDIKYVLPPTWYGKVISLILSISYLFSLLVLFIIGLSAINLSHAVLMTLCFFYMSNIKHVKEYWDLLIIYTLSSIFLRYAWAFVKEYIPDNEGIVFEIIGLSQIGDTNALVLYDYLFWILQLCSSIQQFANNPDLYGELSAYKNVVFNTLEKIYLEFSHFEFWILYIVMFITISLSDCNLVNFFTFWVLILIFTRHLKSPKNYLSLNFSKQEKLLGIFKYYNMAVLAIRYIYQFLPYIFKKEDLPDLKIFGLNVYDIKSLYIVTFGDTVLLVTSVIAHRSISSWLERHKATNHQEENFQETKEDELSASNLTFYDVFSGSFQYIVFITIVVLCIFWKLSASMLGYLIAMGVYQIHIAGFFRSFCSKPIEVRKLVKENKLVMWLARARLWSVMFFMTILYLLLSYFKYLSDFLLGSDGSDGFEVVSYISGFSSNSSRMLEENFGYLVILLVLVIERHCLQFMIPKKFHNQKKVWKEEQDNSTGENDLSQNLLDSDDNLDDIPVRSRTPSDNASITKELIGKDSNPTAIAHIKKDKLIDKVNDQLTYEVLKNKINDISSLNLLKGIVESLILSCVLASAFYKLTIISMVYVFCALLVLCLNDANRIFVIQLILIISIWTQYGLILSNISDAVSPSTVPEVLVDFNIPWYSQVKSYSDQVIIFFNLGKLEYQFTSIFFDLIIQIFVLIYYLNLSTREIELEQLQKALSDIKVDDIEEKKTRVISFKDKLKVFFFKMKVLFFKFARIGIVLTVLLFLTHSVCFISALYCLFCLIFIYIESSDSVIPTPPEDSMLPLNERASLRTNKTSIRVSPDTPIPSGDFKKNNSYSKLLGFFLGLNAFDLTLQILMQTPNYFFGRDEEFWFSAIGIFKLWKDEKGEDLATSDDRYNNITFKVIAFAILLIQYTLLRSKDFQRSEEAQSRTLEIESRQIALKMSHEFNEKRIYMRSFFKKNKNLFNQKLEILERNITIWNAKLYNRSRSNTRKSKTTNSRVLERPQTKKVVISNPTLLKESQPAAENQSIIKLLISTINHSLFREFIKRITVISSSLPDRKEAMAIREEMQVRKNHFYGAFDNSGLESWMKLETESNDEDQKDIYDKRQKSTDFTSKNKINTLLEYDFHMKDWPELLISVLASNTQTLVYFSFFFNHFMYASLESLVFPLSILGYSMLQYPRPKINFFRIMLIYAEVVFFIKFILQLQVWDHWGNNFLVDYKDKFKIGFNRAENTYSETLFYYILWDVVLIFCLLLQEYYTLRIGMWHKVETDIETLNEAKVWFNKPIDNSLDIHKRYSGFFEQLFPRDKSEKPGKDLYLFTILTQLMILCYLFVFFNRMDGNHQDITESLQSNRFQGRMVVAMFIVVAIMLLERYQYLQHISRALKDAAETDGQSKSYQHEATALDTNQEEVIGEHNKTQSFIIKDDYSTYEPEVKSYSALGSDPFRDSFGMKTLNPRQEQKRKTKENERNHLMIIKLALHGALVIIVHFVIFWYFPMNGNYDRYGDLACTNLQDKKKCNNFENNIYLQVFYALYLCYLIVASQQIRFGLPSFTKVSFPLMRKVSKPYSVAFKVYRGVPFLFELRTLMDWTFTKTALDLFQWFKLENIHAHLFITQCYQQGYNNRKPGAQITRFQKFAFGIMGLLIVLLIILLPLFLFSTLNPIFVRNKVTSASVSVKLVVDERTYNIYSSEYPESIKDVGKYWEIMHLDRLEELKSSDKELTQIVQMPISSDNIWEISPSRKESLKAGLEKAMNNTANLLVQVDYSFERTYPTSFPIASVKSQYEINSTYAELLYGNAFGQENMPILIPDLIYRVIRLPSSGEKITPIIIIEDANKPKDLILNLTKDISDCWQVGTNNLEYNEDFVTLWFFTISENYSPITFDFSILTFYISIVYFAGRLIRLVTGDATPNIMMTEMKDPEHLTTFCSAIYVSRMIGNLKKEEELYYELLDILRSSELTKVLTGSSSIKDKLKKD